MRLLSRRISVTADASVVQVKRLHRFPHLRGKSPRLQYLEANATTWFLRTSSVMVVTPPVRTRGGELWAAAYDRTALERIEQSAVERGARVGCVSPAAELVPAELRARNPFVWRPPRRAVVGRGARAALAAAGVLFMIASTTAAVIAPAVRQDRFVAENRPVVNAGRGRMIEAARLRADLARTTRQLSDIVAFADSRGAAAALVTRIGEAIPESSAVVALRVDPMEGSLTTLTSDVAGLLTGLAAIPSVTSVRVTGVLTSEMIGDARMQRATIRFGRVGKRR
jgi:hypothetical protein